MSAKHGNLSINSDNIFPIIKKWMYSDHDIFVRELVSNGCDAITKLKKLDGMGEYTLPDDYKAAIHVIVNPDEKTLKFIQLGSLADTLDLLGQIALQMVFHAILDETRIFAQIIGLVGIDMLQRHFKNVRTLVGADT